MPFHRIKVTINKAKRAVVYEKTVPFSQLSPDEEQMVNEALATPDPYAVLRAKTMHLAELLGCSEEQAEAVILDRIGSPSVYGEL